MKTSLITNISALSGQRTLKKTSTDVKKGLRELSTGKRINNAADDAAGLSISSTLKSKIRSSRRALRNTNDAISFVQVAESSLNNIQESLIRLRELSVQTASDHLSNVERDMVHKEFVELKGEIQRVTLSTRLFEKRLLDGKVGKMEIQVGIHKGKANMLSIDTRKYSNTIHALGVFDIDASSKQRALKSMPKIDYALEEVTMARAYFGSIASALRATQSNLSNTVVEQSGQNSRIEDADYAKVAAENAKNKIIQSAGISVQTQANDRSKSALKLLKGGS